MSKLPPREYTATVKHRSGTLTTYDCDRMPQAVEYCQTQLLNGGVIASIKYRGAPVWGMCRLVPHQKPAQAPATAPGVTDSEE